MRYSLTILECQLEELRSALEHPDRHERAAYLLCGRAVTPSETRLLVQSVVPVASEDVESSSRQHVGVRSRSIAQTFARADRAGQSVVFVHSHPGGKPRFSQQDDVEEQAFFRTAFLRAEHGPHGSLVVAGRLTAPKLAGRLWFDDTLNAPLDRIRVVGRRFRCFDRQQQRALPPWSDRQVRAFGPEVQALLRSLHIGVVGVGGTGSAVAEQLIRLGVGELTVVDEQDLTDSNVTRVYGSSLAQVGHSKVSITQALADSIGLGTRIHPIRGSVCCKETARALRDCDLIFGCTDDLLGRAVLNRLAPWYLIPVIDMAVAIDSSKGRIREITGRVTLLLPGNACLRCRERIDQKRLDAERLQRQNPDEHAARVKEGYAPALGTPDPAVIMFTTGVAARAVSELMHMLTGYLGDDRTTTEILERFHETDVRPNSRPGRSGCLCTSPAKWARGDSTHFLDLTW